MRLHGLSSCCCRFQTLQVLVSLSVAGLALASLVWSPDSRTHSAVGQKHLPQQHLFPERMLTTRQGAFATENTLQQIAVSSQGLGKRHVEGPAGSAFRVDWTTSAPALGFHPLSKVAIRQSARASSWLTPLPSVPAPETSRPPETSVAVDRRSVSGSPPSPA